MMSASTILGNLADLFLTGAALYISSKLWAGFRADSKADKIAETKADEDALDDTQRNAYDSLRNKAVTSRQLGSYQKPVLIAIVMLATFAKLVLAIFALISGN